MNKETLAEEIIRDYNAGDHKVESNLHMKEVLEKIGQALDLKLREYIDIENRDAKNMQYVVPHDFIKTYEVTIADRKGTLTTKPMTLDRNKGIQQVYQDKECDIDSFLVPMRASKSLVNKADLGGMLGYYTRGREIEIVAEDDTDISKITKIYVDMVPSYMDLPKDEDFELPGQVVQQAKGVVLQEVIPMFERGNDNIQDNKDKHDWQKHKHDS